LGGERSDLFSDRVIFEGERISTAFAFKGPAKFEPMTGAHLGKNGDQIDRLLDGTASPRAMVAKSFSGWRYPFEPAGVQ
jgi:hypothetical protein